MRTFVLLDPPFFLPFLKEYLKGVQNVILITNDENPVKQQAAEAGFGLLLRNDLVKKVLFRELNLRDDDCIMLCLSDAEKRKKALMLCFPATKTYLSS